MIYHEAVEIAFTAIASALAEDDREAGEPIPLCATCDAPVAIFPD